LLTVKIFTKNCKKSLGKSAVKVNKKREKCRFYCEKIHNNGEI